MDEILEAIDRRRWPTPLGFLRIYVWTLRTTRDLARCGIRRAWLGLALELALPVIAIAIALELLRILAGAFA